MFPDREPSPKALRLLVIFLLCVVALGAIMYVGLNITNVKTVDEQQVYKDRTSPTSRP